MIFDQVDLTDTESEFNEHQLDQSSFGSGTIVIVAVGHEQFGVWTVTGREAVSVRIEEFIAEADEQIIYMTIDELLTDEHLDRLEAAAERDVEIYLAGISNEVQERIRETVPEANRSRPSGSVVRRPLEAC